MFIMPLVCLKLRYEVRLDVVNILATPASYSQASTYSFYIPGVYLSLSIPAILEALYI